MKKLDFSKPYGMIFGGTRGECFEQDGIVFDRQGLPVKAEVESTVTDSRVIPTDSLDSAKAFLKQILKKGPVSKPAVFKEANNNNQNWADVTQAAVELKITKFNYKDIEQWKLTDI